MITVIRQIINSDYRNIWLEYKSWLWCHWFSTEDGVSGDIVIMITSSGLLWAGLFGILDGVECGADVKVFGLKETSQPSAFISEPHRQHESQRLHQVGVCLCGGGAEVIKRRGQGGMSYTRLKEIRGRMWAYPEAGEGREPPPSNLLDPAVPTRDPGPGPGPQAGGTAALQWRGRPLWSSSESTPHQSLCIPEEYRLGQVYWLH